MTGSHSESSKYVSHFNPASAQRNTPEANVTPLHTTYSYAQLIDASEHRPGFRVFRIKASHLEFRLSDATGSTVDSIHGQNYTIESPGRYVVESGSGCRRLSDAQISDCLRALRPHDRFIEVIFEADPSWFKCYIAYALQGDSDQTWRKVKMSLRCQEPAFWFTRIDARKGLKCAFNNGEGAWDSNCDLNYQMSLPGKYIVGLGSLIYYGPSDLDLHTT